MAKVKYKDLVEGEASLDLLTSGILFESAFALRLKKSAKGAKEALKYFHEQHIAIIKGNGGEERFNPMTGRKGWQLSQPTPPRLDENSSDEEIKKAQDEHEIKMKEFNEIREKADAEFKKLRETDADFVVVAKIPIGDFGSNFITYLSPDLKGKKFGFVPDDLDYLSWLIIEGGKKKKKK